MIREIFQVSNCCKGKYVHMDWDKSEYEEFGKRYLCRICGKQCTIKKIYLEDETKNGKDNF